VYAVGDERGRFPKELSVENLPTLELPNLSFRGVCDQLLRNGQGDTVVPFVF